MFESDADFDVSSRCVVSLTPVGSFISDNVVIIWAYLADDANFQTCNQKAISNAKETEVLLLFDWVNFSLTGTSYV